MIPMHGRNNKPALNSKTVSKIYTVHSYYNTGLRVVGLFVVGLACCWIFRICRFTRGRYLCRWFTRAWFCCYLICCDCCSIEVV